MQKRIGALLAVGAAAAAFGGEKIVNNDSREPIANRNIPYASAEDIKARCIAEMPLRKKLGQLLMIGVDGNGPLDSELFDKYHVGGAIIMGEPQNIQDGRFDEFKNKTDIPLLLATDEEGGQVQRFRSAGVLPAPAEVAASITPKEAKSLVYRHGRILHSAGIDMVFGPLLDIGPVNGIGPMQDRVFSSDPAIVKKYSRAYMRGWRKSGITPVAKHFPGLGAATANTDFSVATTPPIDALRARDELPYRNLGSKNAVMVSHALVPGLSESTPASLNSDVVKGELRGRLGYDGLVVTDSLNAEAIPYEIPKAVVKAVEAGNDMALVVDVPPGVEWSSELRQIRKTLRRAVVKEKTISIKQINNSVGRILTAKHVNACEIK